MNIMFRNERRSISEPNVSSQGGMAMSTESRTHQYARPSLISVVAAAVAITVNHAYPLGAKAFLLGATLLVVPAVLWMWFRRTGSNAAFIGYMLMNAWIIVGFGLMKG